MRSLTNELAKVDPWDTVRPILQPDHYPEVFQKPYRITEDKFNRLIVFNIRDMVMAVVQEFYK